MKRVYFTAGVLAITMSCALSPAAQAVGDSEPYGTAKTNMHAYAPYKRVWDVAYEDTGKLNALYMFISNVRKAAPGDDIVVLHGPELRAFAKENYGKYRAMIDKMAMLADDGVEFRVCNNAMHAAGFEAKDMIGLVTVIPAGFAEISWLESQGFAPINPAVTAVKDSRYIDHPELAAKK